MSQPNAAADDQDSDGRRFAYGFDSEAGVCCPAWAAGYRPSDGDDGTLIPAERYDAAIREKLRADADLRRRVAGKGKGYRNGVAPEEVAREAWLDALNDLRTMAADEHSEVEQRDVEAAEAVARELGWLDDDTADTDGAGGAQ